MKKILAMVAFILLISTHVLAQDFCEGNFDYDSDQDGSDAFTFKTDFGRSSFDNPCPPDGPAPVQGQDKQLNIPQVMMDILKKGLSGQTHGLQIMEMEQ